MTFKRSADVTLFAAMLDDWPFDQPRGCAAITLRPIVFEAAPILHVTHDADDHGWQFLGREDADEAQAAVVATSTIVKLDPSVLAVANLPPGAGTHGVGQRVHRGDDRGSAPDSARCASLDPVAPPHCVPMAAGSVSSIPFLTALLSHQVRLPQGSAFSCR